MAINTSLEKSTKYTLNTSASLANGNEAANEAAIKIQQVYREYREYQEKKFNKIISQFNNSQPMTPWISYPSDPPLIDIGNYNNLIDKIKSACERKTGENYFDIPDKNGDNFYRVKKIEFSKDIIYQIYSYDAPDIDKTQSDIGGNDPNIDNSQSVIDDTQSDIGDLLTTTIIPYKKSSDLRLLVNEINNDTTLENLTYAIYTNQDLVSLKVLIKSKSIRKNLESKINLYLRDLAPTENSHLFLNFTRKEPISESAEKLFKERKCWLLIKEPKEAPIEELKEVPHFNYA